MDESIIVRRYRGQIRVTVPVGLFSDKAMANDVVLRKIGDLSGEGVTRLLRDEACARLGHQWTLFPTGHPDPVADSHEELCERCHLVREKV